MAYNLFISHSWSYSDAYKNLKKLLENYPYFTFRDYSAPKDDSIDDAENDRRLREEIINQIKPASCVLVLAGVYATYSRWIRAEVRIAKQMGKKIIAVQPWGANKTSSFVRANADKIVNWNSESIVNAIRECCRES